MLARWRDPMRGKGATDKDINKLETVSFSEESEGNLNDEAATDNGRCCAICLSDFEEGDKLRVMRCSHRFHKSCVDEWLRVNASCPSCRMDISGAAPSPPSSVVLDPSSNPGSENASTTSLAATADAANQEADSNPLHSSGRVPLHTI